MIIMIDNYDSFTYNLYQYIGTINPDIEVYRNDKITVKEVLEKKPSHIILSPGPGFPIDAGICVDLIKKAGDIPILGVCLGHQAIGEGVELSLPGCREKDTVEVYMTYNMAYGDALINFIPEQSPIAVFYTIDSVRK